MQLFECQVCGQPLYFENVRCENCKHALGYLPQLGNQAVPYLGGHQFLCSSLTLKIRIAASKSSLIAFAAMITQSPFSSPYQT